MGQDARIAEILGQDVRAVQIAASGTVVAGPARLRGIYINSLVGGGAVEFKDGGSGGTSRLILTHPAAVGTVYVPLPDGGIPFGTDIDATMAVGIDTITVFYR